MLPYFLTCHIYSRKIKVHGIQVTELLNAPHIRTGSFQAYATCAGLDSELDAVYCMMKKTMPVSSKELYKTRTLSTA